MPAIVLSPEGADIRGAQRGQRKLIPFCYADLPRGNGYALSALELRQNNAGGFSRKAPFAACVVEIVLDEGSHDVHERFMRREAQ